MSEQFNDFIAAQHTTNLNMVSSLARIEQMQKDTVQRLFGGDGQKGALSYMVESAKEQAESEADRAEKVEIRVGALEGWRSGTLKWIGGVVAVLTLEGTALAFYFTHVAGKIQDVMKIAGR